MDRETRGPPSRTSLQGVPEERSLEGTVTESKDDTAIVQCLNYRFGVVSPHGMSRRQGSGWVPGVTILVPRTPRHTGRPVRSRIK